MDFSHVPSIYINQVQGTGVIVKLLCSILRLVFLSLPCPKFRTGLRELYL